MAEQIQIQEAPPLGRYLLIGLIFVLIFIGVAYLAFRLTRGGTGNPIPTSSPTPTASTAGTQPPTTYIPPLPAPKLPPIDPRKNVFIPQPFANVPKVAPAPISGHTIAQDGFGNLLFDNLTHGENFQLQQSRIQGDTQIRLAQEQTGRTLGAQTLSNEANLDTLKYGLLRQQSQDKSNLDTLDNNNKTRIALQQLQNNLEIERLKQQLAIAQRQQPAQPANTQERIKLLETQTRLQSELATAQAEQARLTQQAQAASQLAQTQTQGQTQVALAKVQAKNQLSQSAIQSQAQLLLNSQQIAGDVTKLSLQQKQRLAELAYQQAANQNNSEYALAAQQLQGDLNRLARADQSQQTLALVDLQGRINLNLLKVSRLFGGGNSYNYGNFASSGYGSYGSGLPFLNSSYQSPLYY